MLRLCRRPVTCSQRASERSGDDLGSGPEAGSRSRKDSQKEQSFFGRMPKAPRPWPLRVSGEADAMGEELVQQEGSRKRPESRAVERKQRKMVFLWKMTWIY